MLQALWCVFSALSPEFVAHLHDKRILLSYALLRSPKECFLSLPLVFPANAQLSFLPDSRDALFQISHRERKRLLLAHGDGGVDVEDGAAKRWTQAASVAGSFVGARSSRRTRRRMMFASYMTKSAMRLKYSYIPFSLIC